MKVVITGGLGFLGRRLADAILRRGTAASPCGAQKTVEAITLFDAPAALSDEIRALPLLSDARVSTSLGDVGCRATVQSLIDCDDVCVFHMASIMSGQGEEDFDLCHHVNLNGTLAVLEACRARASRPRLIFTSSVAVLRPAD